MTVQLDSASAVTSKNVLFDGQDGKFFQSWYPLCLSSEVLRGQVIGRPFLGGKVSIFRGENGVATVVGSYCPHLGADLSVGRVIGDRLQCAFHHWEYDQTGRCVRTSVGDQPPPGARLFAFPTCEKFGVIFAFNGERPLWSLPDFEFPETDLVIRALNVLEFACDGWIFGCNTPDVQHLLALHGFQPSEPIQPQWHRYGYTYRLQGRHGRGQAIDWKIRFDGTNVFQQQGDTDGWWLGIIAAYSCPRPGVMQMFDMIAVRRDGAEANVRSSAEERLTIAEKMGRDLAMEDKPIMDTIRFRRGMLTRTDRHLAQFLDYLARYPRAHPSAAFIT